MYAFGPHEYYHNEKGEPMFRGIKVRNLAAMFEKEENYDEYTLEQFKEWLKKACLEEDWTYIKDWGMLSGFDSILLYNKDIFDYLFQLGMDPFNMYLSNLEDIERLELRLKESNCEYKETRRKILERAKDLFTVSSKYVTPSQIELALKLKGNTDFC